MSAKHYQPNTPAGATEKAGAVQQHYAAGFSPALRSFLQQISGPGGKSDAPSLQQQLAYAMEVVLPHTGWAAEEFVPRFLADLAVPENIFTLEREYRLQKRGHYSAYRLTFSAQGRAAAFLVTPRATVQGDIATLSAIAEVKPAEEMGVLTLDMRQRARLLNVFPGYLALIDSQYKLRFENKAAQEIFGSGLGRHCYEIFRGATEPCKDCPPFVSFHSRGLAMHEWEDTGRRMAFRTYSYPYTSTSGEEMILVIGFNITSGLKTEQALDLSEQRYRSITDNLALGIAVLTPDLGIETANRRLVEWFGQSAGVGANFCAMLGRDCSVPDGCQTCPMLRSFADGKNHKREFSMLSPEREERYFRMLSCPVRGKGKVQSVLALIEDVTEHRRVRQSLHRAQNLEAMGTLAGGIAHEINQPLSALNLYTTGLQLLLEKTDFVPAGTMRERLKLIMEQADKIREIIAHMRALAAQGDALEPGLVSFSEAFEGTLSIMRAQLEAKGIELALKVAPDLRPVYAVRLQLEQVLTNLLSNAVHAVDQTVQGRRLIRVSARNHADGGVYVEVADSGAGFQPGLETRLFDPFYTTKGAHQGMGLGLSLVHAFVTGWGGEVGVMPHHPELGGAVFYLLLRSGAPTGI